MKTTILSATVIIATVFCSVGTGRAAIFDAPITFSQAGDVTLTLNHSSGGYDHILNILYPSLGVRGIVGFLTDSSDPSATVQGHTPYPIGTVVTVGTFGANEELIFRLDNFESLRLGMPGVPAGSIFSGSAHSQNPDSFFTLIEEVDPFTRVVHFEDLGPTSNNVQDFVFNRDVSFTLSLTPVPIPGAILLYGAGLAGLAAFGRLRSRMKG